MKGSTLYPLNVMKDIYPDVYDENLKKYEGREQVLEHSVPILNCLWNDVIHLSPVHPRKIEGAYLQYSKKELLGRNYFEIDSNSLDRHKCVVYLYKHESPSEKWLEENWNKFDPVVLEEYREVPKETLEYYKEELTSNREPLLWHRIPHILYEGEIDVTLHKSITI